MQTIPTPIVLDFIKRQLSYNPATGIISRGGKALGYKTGWGHLSMLLYLDTRYEGCGLVYQTRAHQVAWYLAYGVWADKFIDHIDGNPSNNRLDNLRLVTSGQNSCNQRKLRTRQASSQYKGVTLVSKKWRAYITSNGKRIELGYHSTELEAALAYNAKATELFGEYACLNAVA